MASPKLLTIGKQKRINMILSRMKSINADAHLASRAAPAAGHGPVQYISAMWWTTTKYIYGGLNYENSVPMYTGASWYYFWSTQMDQVTAPARRGATGCTQLWCSPAAPPVVRGAGLPYGIVASCDVTLLELWRVWRTRHERMARPSHMLSIHIMS